MYKIISISILVAIFISGCNSSGQSDKMKAMMKSKIAEVELTNPTERLAKIDTELSGKAEAKQIVEIKPRTDGFVKKIFVKDFQKVKNGQILYKIESTQLENSVEASKANVFKTKTVFQAALSNLERYQELFKTNSISKSELDNAKNIYAQSKSDYLNAEAKLKTDQLNLSYTSITAPISGTIEANNIYVGSLVNTNSSTLNKIYDMSTVFILTSIPDDIFNKVEKSIFMYDNQKAILDSCSPTMDENTKMHTCKLVLKNPKNITNGQNLKLTMQTEERVLTIPQKAITQNKASKAVFIVKNGKADYKNVEVGDWVDDLIVIKSGLKKEDSFIMNIAKVKFGADVKVK